MGRGMARHLVAPASVLSGRAANQREYPLLGIGQWRLGILNLEICKPIVTSDTTPFFEFLVLRFEQELQQTPACLTIPFQWLATVITL